MYFDEDRKIRWNPTLSAEDRCLYLQEQADLFPHVENFVETGTADGMTCVWMSGFFNRLVTIEIVPSVYENTKMALAEYTNIECYLGDSALLLPTILMNLDAPCFFWLDGHYCGHPEARPAKDTPVADELQIIFRTNLPHVIFVDDARLFGWDPGYPTLDWVRNLAVTQDIHYDFSVANDIMRIVPC